LRKHEEKRYSPQFPVYQVNFTATNTGKQIASTKRKVYWRFGFCCQDDMSAGATGTECRGEEHEVIFKWSISSGKRGIYLDGHQVHFSLGASGGGKFEFSWLLKGIYQLKIIASSSSPMFPMGDFRQYDFLLDGRSFFDMPKIFELGVTAGWSDSYNQYDHNRYIDSAPHPTPPPYNPTYKTYEIPRDPLIQPLHPYHDNYAEGPISSSMNAPVPIPPTITHSFSEPPLVENTNRNFEPRLVENTNRNISTYSRDAHSMRMLNPAIPPTLSDVMGVPSPTNNLMGTEANSSFQNGPHNFNPTQPPSLNDILSEPMVTTTNRYNNGH